MTLPPHQRLAAPGKWPVVGEKAPRQNDDRAWTLTLAGQVAEPRILSLAALATLPTVTERHDIHCVTRWSRLGMSFTGVRLSELLVHGGGPLPEARFVSFVARSDRNHSTSLPLADALALGCLIVTHADGNPLEEIHGGPLRVVTPGRYFYKSVKWLERIELLTEDRLGYWEAETGYHNRADPWKEERYIAPDINPRVLERALARRDFSGLDLRGVDLRGRDLSGLRAVGALLRDAHFEQALLRDADFTEANLSNAHLEHADLTGACFVRADVEGAAFDQATLRNTNFTDASLFGTTFDGAAR